MHLLCKASETVNQASHCASGGLHHDARIYCPRGMPDTRVRWAGLASVLATSPVCAKGGIGSISVEVAAVGVIGIG